jgi:hypothetical protein
VAERRYQYESPKPIRKHSGQELPAHIEHASQVRPQHVVPLLVRHGEHEIAPIDPGIGNHGVDISEVVQKAVADFLDCRGKANIELISTAMGFRPNLPGGCHNACCALFIGHMGEANVMSLPNGFQNDRLSNAS